MMPLHTIVHAVNPVHIYCDVIAQLKLYEEGSSPLYIALYVCEDLICYFPLKRNHCLVWVKAMRYSITHRPPRWHAWRHRFHDLRLEAADPITFECFMSDPKWGLLQCEYYSVQGMQLVNAHVPRPRAYSLVYPKAFVYEVPINPRLLAEC